jgi:hypothetical protein
MKGMDTTDFMELKTNKQKTVAIREKITLTSVINKTIGTCKVDEE